MKAIIFTNGKKAVKTYKEVCVKSEGCFKEGEVLRMFQTDNIRKVTGNGSYQTTFVEVV